jgi:uncharacterized protein
MVIAIFRSLEGENLEDFSIRLAQQWRIGRKGLDKGVILLVFPQDRKVRFEIGYGLEPVVPDAAAGQIIRSVIAPRFREGRYADGLEGAVKAIFTRVAAARGPTRRPEPEGRPAPVGPALGFVAILVLLALVLLQEALSARRYVGRNAYTASRHGWDVPIVMAPPWWGRGGGWGGGFGGGGFSGGGGAFGGGGASGEW